MRGWRLTGPLMVAALAGCASGAGGAGPRPAVSIAADPAAALAQARAELGTESARFSEHTGTAVLDYTGVVNARTGSWEITGPDYVVRRIGLDLYVQAKGQTLDTMLLSPEATAKLAAGGWAHTKVPYEHQLYVVFNDDFPWNEAKPVSRATGLTKVGARSFAGTVATPASQNGSRHPATTMRLRVDLDDQGRFSTIGLVDQSSPDVTNAFTYSDFGLKANITAPPPNDVVEEDNFAFTAALPLA